MNDRTPCGCELQFMIDNHRHVCDLIPPYHFGPHECKCGKEWPNE